MDYPWRKLHALFRAEFTLLHQKGTYRVHLGAWVKTLNRVAKFA